MQRGHGTHGAGVDDQDVDGEWADRRFERRRVGHVERQRPAAGLGGERFEALGRAGDRPELEPFGAQGSNIAAPIPREAPVTRAVR